MQRRITLCAHGPKDRCPPPYAHVSRPSRSGDAAPDDAAAAADDDDRADACPVEPFTFRSPARGDAAPPALGPRPSPPSLPPPLPFPLPRGFRIRIEMLSAGGGRFASATTTINPSRSSNSSASMKGRGCRSQRPGPRRRLLGCPAPSSRSAGFSSRRQKLPPPRRLLGGQSKPCSGIPMAVAPCLLCGGCDTGGQWVTVAWHQTEGSTPL